LFPLSESAKRFRSAKVKVTHCRLLNKHCTKFRPDWSMVTAWWSYDVISIFTALHVMQTRYCDEISVRPSVRLSVRLSVCHTRGLWQNGRKIGPDLYTIRKNIYPSFMRKRMVGGGRPLLREILGQPTPVGTK